MATGVKAAAFAGLLRLLIYGFTPLWSQGTLYQALYVMAILTMTLGNFVAIAQKNLKRMLAYSSIAHAGYILVGLTALAASSQYARLLPGTAGEMAMFSRGLSASSAVLFYLLGYTFMNLGAFGVIILVGREKAEGDTLNGFAGLARRRPALAAVMAICMFSLAGVPPFVGFAAKFYIFQSAISCRLYILAIIGVLNSVVSAYYYLRVLVVMYMEEEKVPMAGGAPLVSGAAAANALMAAVVVLMGVFPQPVLNLIDKVFSREMMDLIMH
ncbi:MAG TPA: proton-conducting transporter membrane subunit, partial [bacterium]|nr:proton-conducting transporter membrane subunit [bacterium]